ncbi:MAG: mechanosensitive ion channel family protein [Acidobacteriaceae bacterium]|nr:mechanosensitive ion channel family protein [Acidobacteriaceae bacterium]
MTFLLKLAAAAASCWGLLAPIAVPQSLGGLLNGQKTAAAAPAAADPLKRETPRTSIRNLLEACHADHFSVAAQYLDLSSLSSSARKSKGSELARSLCRLLNENPRFEINHLSNDPAGNAEDGLPADTEILASFELNDKPVTLELSRQNQQGFQVWVVSPSSVALIPELSSSDSLHSAIAPHLPAPFTKIQFTGTPLWIWLALIVAAIILSLLSRALSKLLLIVVRFFARRYAKGSDAVHRLEAFTEPLRLIVGVIVFRVVMGIISPSALAREYLLKLLVLLFIIGAAQLVMRILDVISDRVVSRLDPRERALTYSVLPLGMRIFKVCVFILAILVTLSAWGYNTNAILAGVGVGGIAVALAAQKTIENLFGGFSVISDRPVLVGDFCQVGGQTGTVEDIGLRSTRIRTLDRTVLTIPNSQFSTMTLENFSKRDKMWFHPVLQLRPETPPVKLRAMMDAVTKILQEHPMVDASGVPLRFTRITPQSLQLEIFAYVLTPDYNQFLVVQSELLLKIMDAAAELDIGFAVPFSEAITIPFETALALREHPSVPMATVGASDGAGSSGQGEKALES